MISHSRNFIQAFRTLKLTNVIHRVVMTLQKLITVTIEVVTRRARELFEILVLHAIDVFCRLAFAIFSVFAAHITEVIFLFALALQQLELEANGTAAILRNRRIIYLIHHTYRPTD